MNWFMTALKNYAVFSGRSRRSEYWYFGLFYLIFYAVCAIVDGITGSFDRASGIGIFTGILAFAPFRRGDRARQAVVCASGETLDAL